VVFGFVGCILIVHMKQLFKFLIIFIVGAVTYAVLNPLLTSYLQREQTPLVVEVSTSTPAAVVQKAPEVTIPVVEETIQIDQTGGVHDGPFTLYLTDGTKAKGTVQIIRSPEETLLQFENTEVTHSADSLIYFATDVQATKFFSIGKAQLEDNVFIYGMPLDVNVGIYKYILIYNPKTKSTELYAKI
jgi:hypothetical protein